MKKADLISLLESIPDDEELAFARAGESPYKAEVIGTLAKAADDEPLFLARAADMSASFLVRYWAIMAVGFGVSAEKRASATQRALEFEQWPGMKKVPD